LWLLSVVLFISRKINGKVISLALFLEIFLK
jgi:hypothetical protein